ncbi:MAG: hypothetical protein ACLVCE_03925 [Anaerovoracaceae bacterium]
MKIWKKSGSAPYEYSFNKDELKKIHRRDCMTFFLVLMGITFIALIFQGIVANPDVNITMFYILGIVLVARYTYGYVSMSLS